MNIHLEIQDKCFLNCLHCSKEKSNETVIDYYSFGSRHKVFEYLKKIKDKDNYLYLTGGEPLYNIELLKSICQQIKALGNFKMGILTTGILREKGELRQIWLKEAKDFKDNGIDSVTISMYSIKPEVHDKITRIEGSHLSTICSLHTFMAVGIETNVNICLTAINYKSLDRTIEFLKSTKVNKIKILELINHGNASKNWKRLELNQEFKDQVLTKYKDDSRIQMYCFNNCNPCTAGAGKLYIDVYGRVMPCARYKNDDSKIIERI